MARFGAPSSGLSGRDLRDMALLLIGFAGDFRPGFIETEEHFRPEIPETEPGLRETGQQSSAPIGIA